MIVATCAGSVIAGVTIGVAPAWADCSLEALFLSVSAATVWV